MKWFTYWLGIAATFSISLFTTHLNAYEQDDQKTTSSHPKSKDALNVEQWKNEIDAKFEKIRILSQQSATSLKNVKQIEYEIKHAIYDQLVQLLKMTNPHTAIHGALQGKSPALSWYQRWIGFAFGPNNHYQYFQKHIFPLLRNTPLYQDLADQGVIVVIAGYTKELKSRTDYIQKNFNATTFEHKESFLAALSDLHGAFSSYELFLETNKKLLPIGSFNTLASNPIFRHIIALSTGGAAAGYMASQKLGLDPKKIVAHKHIQTELYTQVAKTHQGIVLPVAQKTIGQKAQETFKKGFWFKRDQDKQAPTIQSSKPIHFRDLPGKTAATFNEIAQDHYKQSVQNILGKTLATIVAAYLGYKFIQWLMRDWPRKPFSPTSAP